MEVFAVPTPTSSGNYKPNLESFFEKRQRHARAPRIWLANGLKEAA